MQRLPEAGERFAGWRLRRRLGRGAHGVVYLAEHEQERRVAALKLVPLAPGDDAAPDAFERQARVAQRLLHPGIVELWAAGVHEGVGWLAMEPVPGADLVRYTQPARLLPEAKVLELGERIARALAHAHQMGVVHRDLKPANVMVHWPSDSVKITDLGLARTADAEGTRTGVVPGTPAYMAPEQLAGAVPDARSDLYALGVMLFELLTGRLPHDAPNLGELLRRVANEDAPDLRHIRPELPPALAEWIARLLARRAAERPADAARVADALLAIRLALTPKP